MKSTMQQKLTAGLSELKSLLTNANTHSLIFTNFILGKVLENKNQLYFILTCANHTINTSMQL